MSQDKVKSSWIRKFANAFRGIGVGAWGQNSFLVHVSAALVVLLLAWSCQVTPLEFGLLVLCIGLVLVSEYFNSALEHLCRALIPDENEQIRNVLDIGSAAVLVASICAAVVGCRILLPYLFAG